MSFDAWPWFGLLALGGLHGVNPAMGWLFAVALGIQERDGRAVWRALPPLAAGHALAVGAVVAAALLAGRALPPAPLKWTVAAALCGFGLLRLARTRHPRYGGMQVGARQLATWSFLMATAHGAGLMVLPVLLAAGGGTPANAAVSEAGLGIGAGAAPEAHVGAAHADGAFALGAGLAGGRLDGLLATALHTAAYLAVAGLTAAIVYRKVGLRFLRKGWFNLDRIWGGALVATGALTLLL